MVERDEDFLSREKNEEEKLAIRGKTEARVESVLKPGLVHRHTFYDPAVTLSGNPWSDFYSKLGTRKVH